MNPSGYLELAIAFVFIMLLLSTLTSGINELIAHLLNTRGKFLKDSISEIFKSKSRNYAEAFYDHPMVDALKKTQTRLPSYISSSVFADTMIAVIGNEYEKNHERIVQNPETLEVYLDESNRIADPFERFQKGLEEMPYSDLKILLRNISEQSGSADSLKKNLSKWYDDYMERASGWYKNKIQVWLFIIGLGVAVFMNVDTFSLLSALKRDNVLRTQLADAAGNYLQTHSQEISNPDSLALIIGQIDQTYKEIDAYDLPIGWEKVKSDKFTISAFVKENELSWRTIFGWLATAGLLSFGSPFWFQLLNKLINLRKSGAKPKVTE